MKKSIFITGAAMGIGKAVATLYAARGWHVGITDIDKPGLESLKKQFGDKIAYSAMMDVTDSDRVAAVIAEFAKTTGGKIDVFFNDAGVAWLDPFEEQPLSHHYATLDVNNKGILNCAYHSFPYLKNAKGTLVNMCSQAANYGVPWEVTYSASKFWIRGFTESLNIEWQRHGIYVCAIWPNFVDTPMMEKCSSILSKRVGINLKAEDVANTVWKAVRLNWKFRVHWRVDSLGWKILGITSAMGPQFIPRYVFKKLAGL